MNNKIFSIIIPTYNCENVICSTLESIKRQKNNLYQLIIIDGCSEDNTIKIINNYRNLVNKLIVEKDKGIYDAMNKGVKHATGKYVYFLGAGDILEDNILEKLSTDIPNEDINFLYGNVYYGSNKNRIYDGKFNQYKLTKINICHQAIFYSREIFSMIGYYDLKYKIFADWAYNIKCFGDKRIHKKYVNEIISTYQDDGISSRVIDNEFINDYIKLIKHNFPNILYIFVLLKHGIKVIIRKLKKSQ
jgi:glycosyltransferase involved in cell wall biosynthesis